MAMNHPTHQPRLRKDFDMKDLIAYVMGFFMRLFPCGLLHIRLMNHPIVAFVGLNGHGKTMCMAEQLIWDCDRLPEHVIISNTPIFDWEWEPDGDETEADRPLHPRFVPLRKLQQLVQADKCILFLDEITGIANSLDGAGIPVQLVNACMQMRRKDALIRYSTPAYSRCHRSLRQVTTAVVHSKGYLPVRSVDPVTGLPRAWGSRRFFVWTAYDATQFEDFTSTKRDRMKPFARGYHWRAHHSAQVAYRTLEPVAALDHVHDTAGFCMECGGQRTRPKCICKTDRPGPSTSAARRQPREQGAAAPSRGADANG